MAETWVCPNPKCRWKNEKPKRKCVMCGRAKRKKRVVAHARTLRDESYAAYEAFSLEVHPSFEPDSCRVCGKPRHESMNHHRDHDHVTGEKRGVVCFQCNRLMPRLLTLERARAVVAYLERVEASRVLAVGGGRTRVW